MASACCCCCVPGAGDLLSELDLRFMGGMKLPVNFCCVMKGCSLACCGDHRSSGLMLSNPLTKSMNASRLLISIVKSVRYLDPEMECSVRTSVLLRLFHVLPWHWISLDDLSQGIGLEVFLAGLLLRAMLSGVLFHALQGVCPAAELV